MKKIILALVLLMSILTSANAQVIITEIMYNPPESGTDSLEYIELHNFNNMPADISGWSFTQGVTHTFPAGTIMSPGGYLVLAKSASAFQSVFGFAPTVWQDGALINSPGEDIELSDAAGTVIDYVDYKNAAPWPLEANGMGSSLVLCDFNADNSLPANWQAASTGTGVMINGNEVKANPGAASGCTSVNEITAVDDDYSVPSDVPTLLNVQGNDLIINALTLFIVVTPPTQGSATVSGSGISYQPNPGYCGPDEFTYQICDAAGCDEATVTLNVKCYPALSIAAVTGENPDGTATSLNTDCAITGTVYGVNLRPINNSQPSLLFTIIDDNGDGIAVSTLGGTFGYTVQEKDKVTVRGTIGQFNGQTEIRPDTILKNSSDNPLLVPAVVTALSEATESKLVKINNLRFVDPTEWTNGVGGSGFNVRVVSDNSPQDTILLRIDRDVETYDAPVPAEPFDLTGIGGQFDATNPYNSGYQILPRYNPDISTITIGTKEVDFSHYVLVSPNPVTTLLNIEMNTSFDRLTLLNTKGQFIKTYHKPGPQQKVDVSLYKPGVYFARFEKGGKTWTTRFVKQ
jgi:hypothetical protein